MRQIQHTAQMNIVRKGDEPMSIEVLVVGIIEI